MSANTSGVVQVVRAEIHNVIAAMRLNSRFFPRAGNRFSKEVALAAEHPLVRQLKGLHEHLLSAPSLARVDTVRIVSPFVDVVRDARASGPITGAALSSLHKFLLYGFLSPDAPRARQGAELLGRCVALLRSSYRHCFFFFAADFSPPPPAFLAEASSTAASSRATRTTTRWSS